MTDRAPRRNHMVGRGDRRRAGDPIRFRPSHSHSRAQAQVVSRTNGTRENACERISLGRAGRRSWMIRQWPLDDMAGFGDGILGWKIRVPYGQFIPILCVSYYLDGQTCQVQRSFYWRRGRPAHLSENYYEPNFGPLTRWVTCLHRSGPLPLRISIENHRNRLPESTGTV